MDYKEARQLAEAVAEIKGHKLSRWSWRSFGTKRNACVACGAEVEVNFTDCPPNFGQAAISGSAYDTICSDPLTINRH